MDEDWILYFTTTFTFTVIFGLCYIRYVYTFFERNKIQGPTSPTFPFGNVYDVIFQKSPMFMQLWKFYNRFKRKKCSMGGLYIFLKPAILMMDSKQTEMVLSRKKNQYFSDVTEDDTNPFLTNLLCKICENIQRIWPRLVSKFQQGEEVNLSQSLCQDNLEMAVEELFKVKPSKRPQGGRSAWGLLKTIIFLGYPYLTRIFKSSDKEEKYCKNILDELVKNRDENISKNDDFGQLLLTSGLSNDEMKNFIVRLITNLIKANNLVLFTLYELSDNQEIQEDLRGEITRFCKNRSPSNYYDELSNLTYLETVICETLRKYPLVPFVYSTCKEDYVDNKIHVEKDTLVFISTFGIHHDSQNYTNPELFDPDRFSEENLKFIDSTKYLPFGYHKENGFDTLYVRMLMKISLIELLSRFKFSLGNKSPKSVQFDERVFEFLKMKQDCWLKINRL